MKKFEVGKKYRGSISGTVYECVYANDQNGVISFNDTLAIRSHANIGDMYIEIPPEIIRFVKLDANMSSGNVVSGSFERMFNKNRLKIHTHKVTFNALTGELISVEKLRW